MKKYIVQSVFILGNQLNAQLTSFGFQGQKPLYINDINLYGIELSRANYFYDLGLGYLMSDSKQIPHSKITARLDLNYILHVGNACSQKRIREINPYDFSKF
jgi:hypothetical protein